MSQTNQIPTRLHKKEFAMIVAHLAATRGQPREKVTGACIMDDINCILGYGYNGFIQYNSDLRKNDKNDKQDPSLYCHAPRNAIDYSTRSVRGATMFVTKFPCVECAKSIVQSGIKRLIYENEKTIADANASKLLEDGLEEKPITYSDYFGNNYPHSSIWHKIMEINLIEHVQTDNFSDIK